MPAKALPLKLKEDLFQELEHQRQVLENLRIVLFE
jgi:hypothetical protein